MGVWGGGGQLVVLSGHGRGVGVGGVVSDGCLSGLFVGVRGS